MEILIFIFIAFLFLAILCGLTAVSALILMWAWNLGLPAVWLAAPTLTFWPAVAILVLIGFIGNIFSRTTVIKQK